MEQKIAAVLWDIDGTLLNFPAAERAAIHTCFVRFGLGRCVGQAHSKKPPSRTSPRGGFDVLAAFRQNALWNSSQ